MINGSEVTVLHAYELYLSPGNEFGGFSDITIQSESGFVIKACEEGPPYLTPQSRALLFSLNGAAAVVRCYLVTHLDIPLNLGDNIFFTNFNFS